MAAILIGLASITAFAAQPPVDLRCALRVNPLGIGDANPRLSWQLQPTDGARGEFQTAFEIQVGSTPGAADLWDSGKVASSATVDVVYAGQPLNSGEKCYWQVRVYDGSNNVSAWSETNLWSMGLLNSTDWQAQWVGYDAAYNLTPQQTATAALLSTAGLGWISYNGETTQNGFYSSALRDKIYLAPGQFFTNALMAVYADNQSTVYVNGTAMTNTVARWEATTWINVTPWLHAGTNEIALNTTSTDDQQPAQVIGRLVIQFASGSVSNIPVDTTWKAAQWPTGAWTLASYNDSAWTTPNSGSVPWGTPALNDIARVPAPYLRKGFSVTQNVTRATVYVTALGSYELHLNGQKVGNDVMTPGWTHFPRRVYYQTYDVTGMVQNGTNTIGAILGDGWYCSVIGFTGRREFYGGTPRLLAQLVLQLADGSTQTVVSDSSWEASYGPIQWGDNMLGSEYDARLEMPGWDTPNFNAGAWSPVYTGINTNPVGYANVTALVAGLVSNNQLDFVANNATMGGDPAFGLVKTFQITFTLGGTNETLTYPENGTVQIGNGSQTLKVINALYGNALDFSGSNAFQVQAAVTEPSRCLETRAATSLTEPTAGCYTFDLGQNMVGWVQLNISGKVGDRITVRHGEITNSNGTIFTSNLRGATATDYYIFGTNGTVIFQPRFTFHGFRYVEIRGLTVPPTINSVTGIVVHSDITRAGNFACSDALVNQLYSNIIWSHKGNYLETATDCPQRDERLGWTGDTEFFVPTAAYDYDVQSFFRRHLVTLAEDTQEVDGNYDNVAPTVGGEAGTAWDDAAFICTYNMYRSYGDTNVAGDHYAALQRYGQYLTNYVSNFLMPSRPNDLGDWLGLGGSASETVIDTAFYAYYAQAMSELAAAIGKSGDAAMYASLHSNVVAAFGTLFNPDGTFADGSSQTGYGLAFTLNLVPPALRTLAAQQFANTIAAYGNHLATGFIGTPRLLPGLHLAGRDDLAYSLLLQQSYPSWLWQVDQGSTTMWETWNGALPMSFNHYSFGAVGQYLYSTIGGINPVTPGYATIQIQPVPGAGLTWANTSYNSTRGLISTAWTNTGANFSLATVIPPNTTAQVYVPTTNAAAITESGVPATSSPGVIYVGTSNGSALYSVGSGSYFWSSPYGIPVPPGPVITTTNQTGAEGIAFNPAWTAVTNLSLIAGKLPSVATGNFNEEPYLGTRNVNSLTLANNLTITTGGSPNTTSPNYVTCGNGSGSGSELIYTLTNSALGYDLTNITVYGGWGDNGRDQQAYTLSYAAAANPTNFMQLTMVNFTPSVGTVPSATRVTITGSTGVLATNAVAIKFDFTNPASENGYCGYAAITAFGAPSVAPAVPAALGASHLPGSPNFLMNVSGLVVGRNYTLQTTTNLTSGVWSTTTNFTATQTSAALTNTTAGATQLFYRILGY